MNVKSAIKRLLLFPHDYEVRAKWTGIGGDDECDYHEDDDGPYDYHPLDMDQELDEHDVVVDNRYKVVWIDLEKY